MSGRQIGPGGRPRATVRTDWSTLLDAFLVEKRHRSGSERTPDEYGRYVRRFLASGIDPISATPLDVYRFGYALRVDGGAPSASTVGVRLAAIGGFFDFAVRMRVIKSNPARAVRRPCARPPVPRGMSRVEVRRLLDVIPASPDGLRDRAVVLTALLTGLRREELVSIRLADLEGRHPTVVRIRVKGGRVRVRELPPPAVLAIEAALGARPGRSRDADERLFGLSASGWYARLRRLGELAGIAGLSPHVLRHTAAKLRREAGASIEDVSALLGHTSVATTATYLARLEGERDEGWLAVMPALGLQGNGADFDPDARPSRPRRAPSTRGRTAGRRFNRSGGRGNAHPISRIGGQHRAPLPRPHSSR